MSGQVVGLLERERELSEVERVLGSAADGDGAAVLVQGDAGLGKTALLAAAADSAHARDFQVLEARADRLESELSFGVCIELFRRAARPGEARPSEDLFAGAAALARPVLDHASAIEGVPGEDRTLPLINGLYWLCTNLAERRPLLVSIDDAHWSDIPSLRFVNFLVRRLEGIRVAVLVAARPGGASTGAADLLAAIGAQPRVGAVPLERLGPAAAAQLVEAELGEFDPEFAQACSRLSGGNPLYLRELLRSALVQGIEPTSESVDALRELRPEGIAESVLARLAAIGEPASRLAQVAAAAGGRLHLRDAAAVAELDHHEARELADALAGAAVLAPGEPLAFPHPLVQAAVYESIVDAARAHLHARIAALLRDTGASPEVIAAHLLHAERRLGTWALDELQAAATAATSRGSPSAAARYLRCALDQGPTGERRAQLLVALGLAETEAGEPDGRERLTAAVEFLPAPEQRAGVLLGLGMILTTQGDIARATDAYERGIAAAAGAGSRVARDLEALCAVGLVHDADARAEALPRIDALLGDAEIDRSPTGRLLLAQAAAERGYQGGSIAELRELVARALAPGIDENDPTTFWTYVLAAYAYDDCDEYDRAEQAIARAVAIARRRGSVLHARAACHPQAFVNARRGRISAALTDAETSTEGAEHGWRVALPSSRAILADAHLERGDLAQATAAVELPGGDGPWARLISYGWLLAARGRVQLEQGDPAEALRTLTACGEFCDHARLVNPAVVSWRSTAALAASRLDRHEQAHELIDEELALSRAFGAPRAVGIAERTLGLVLRDERAIEPLRASVATLERSQARLEHARALVDLGAALRRRGHRREAREPLREGLDSAHRCGAAALAARASDELQAAGARPRRYQLTGVEALTPTERRVAALAAEGLSNPQIAQALFVARRTVEMHLTGVYRKLDIDSRTELVSALYTNEQAQSVAGSSAAVVDVVGESS